MNTEGFGKMSENFRHFSNRVTNFSEIDWSDGLKSVGISAEGKDGVILIETQKGSVVFKASDDVSTDVFMTKLANKLLVRAPQIRVISYDSAQFKQMMRAIEKYCYTNELLYQVIMRRLNRPFYQLMEYIPSIKLNSIGKERFQVIFESEMRLGQLGRILGFDMIFNNSDRIQLYWTNEGNSDNLLFQVKHKHGLQLTKKIVDDYADVDSVEFGNIFMIDTRPTIIDPTNKMANKNYEIMTQRLLNFIKKLLQFIKQTDRSRSDDLGNNLFQKLNDQFHNHTGCKFNNYQQTQIGKSILRVLFGFYLSFPVNKLSQLVYSLKRTNKLWEDTYWNQSLDSLHMNYFAGLRETFETHLLPDQALLRQLAAEVNQVSHNNSQQISTSTHQQILYSSRQFVGNIQNQNQKSSSQLAAILGQERSLEELQQQEEKSDTLRRKDQSAQSRSNKSDPQQVGSHVSSVSQIPTPASKQEPEFSANSDPNRSSRQTLKQKLLKFRNKNTLQ